LILVLDHLDIKLMELFGLVIALEICEISFAKGEFQMTVERRFAHENESTCVAQFVNLKSG
jgi:hypothetical protein